MEESPAREEGEHAVVLALMHGGEDEDELLVVLLMKGYVGRFLVVDWAVLVGSCWVADGLPRPGMVQVCFFSSFLFSIFCFIFSI
jgi:hypothetical protein